MSQYVCRCPVGECRGLINKSSMSCGVCDSVVCRRCHDVKVEEHECNPTTLETIQFLRTDTRSCPNCAVPIHRIEGCNQMWCVECNVAFDWVTGALSTGPIHNPEYFRWRSGLTVEQLATLDNGGAVGQPLNPCHRVIEPVSIARKAYVMNAMWKWQQKCLLTATKSLKQYKPIIAQQMMSNA